MLAEGGDVASDCAVADVLVGVVVVVVAVEVGVVVVTVMVVVGAMEVWVRVWVGSTVGWLEVMVSATAMLVVAVGGGGAVMGAEVGVVTAGPLTVMSGGGRVEVEVV